LKIIQDVNERVYTVLGTLGIYGTQIVSKIYM